MYESITGFPLELMGTIVFSQYLEEKGTLSPQIAPRLTQMQTLSHHDGTAWYHDGQNPADTYVSVNEATRQATIFVRIDENQILKVEYDNGSMKPTYTIVSQYPFNQI